MVLNEQTVAFFGLGNMGKPMASLLAKAVGHLVLYDTRHWVAKELAEAIGAEAVEKPGDAVLGADFVITMLPNSDVVRSVIITGDNPILASLPKGSTIIDMSSSFAPTTCEIGETVKAAGNQLLDAPVSGGVKRAENGTLAIMLGGDHDEAIERAEPLLSLLGKVHRTGRLGSGHALKALNNFVSAAGLAAACEAIVIGRTFGLDPETMIDVINQSSGKNNATENKFHQFILNREFNSGFALDLMTKDLKTASMLADALNRPLPSIRSTVQLWESARRSLHENADHTAYFQFVEAIRYKEED